MINTIYQLISPRSIAVKFEDISCDNKILVRPRYLALCHADQRYYQGKREPKVLRRKLPMALIHECMGEVVADPTGVFSLGCPVVLIPNIAECNRQSEIYENYASRGFCSSGIDGFMRELVDLSPDRVVSCDGVPPKLAAITEFVSVAVHAASRFNNAAHSCRERIAIIGDGSMGYVAACVLSVLYPDSSLVVIGRSSDKLALFTFVKERYLSDDLPSGLAFDHAFECAGGEGSLAAIDTIISHINPQGTLVLLGVSEQPVPIRTRDVLEKGITLVGCSRSGHSDFREATVLLRNSEIQQRLSQIIFLDEPVRDIAGMKRVFATDSQTPFKTVFGWDV